MALKSPQQLQCYSGPHGCCPVVAVDQESSGVQPIDFASQKTHIYTGMLERMLSMFWDDRYAGVHRAKIPDLVGNVMQDPKECTVLNV